MRPTANQSLSGGVSDSPKIGQSLRQGLAPADKLLAWITKTNAVCRFYLRAASKLAEQSDFLCNLSQTRDSNPGRRCHCCRCNRGFADTA